MTNDHLIAVHPPTMEWLCVWVMGDLPSASNILGMSRCFSATSKARLRLWMSSPYRGAEYTMNFTGHTVVTYSCICMCMREWGYGVWSMGVWTFLRLA